MMNGNETFLIEQMKKGNEEAFKAVFRAHYAVLCHFASSLVHDDMDAEQIVDDVLYHVWEIKATLNIQYSLRSYLLRSVRHRCLDFLKSRQKAADSMTLCVDEAMDSAQADLHPLGILLEKELEAKIMEVIESIPADTRRVFRMSRIEGLKYDEIAAQLNISQNTVKYHIKRALRILSAELAPYLYVLLIFWFMQ